MYVTVEPLKSKSPLPSSSGEADTCRVTLGVGKDVLSATATDVLTMVGKDVLSTTATDVLTMLVTVVEEK